MFVDKSNNTQQEEPSKAIIKPASPTKLMGLFLIAGSLTLFTLWIFYDFAPSMNKGIQHTEASKRKKTKSGFQSLWEEDIKLMFEGEVFHKGIASVRKVRVFMLDQNLHSQLKHLRTPFKQEKDGQNLLEVSFMSHHSDIEKAEKLIVQYNLTDKDSGNMFWEHSRTITIPNQMLAD